MKPLMSETRTAVIGALIVALGSVSMALYTPAMLKVLEEDFAKIPALLEQEIEPVPSLADLMPEPTAEPEPVAVQLGLF